MEETKIFSPEEEINYLRQRINELEKRTKDEKKTEIIAETIKNYAKEKPEEILDERFRFSQTLIEEHKNRIAKFDSEDNLPEQHHNEQITELLQLAQDKGILNAISIAKKIDPHLEDDFHTALVNNFSIK